MVVLICRVGGKIDLSSTFVTVVSEKPFHLYSLIFAAFFSIVNLSDLKQMGGGQGNQFVDLMWSDSLYNNNNIYFV